ncbi:NAD(P)H-quinone oxidoreductase [Myxococcota bacterium]|nr:NAD(P)H-quinone oxidoreductase [Myxococcota bacterium]
MRAISIEADGAARLGEVPDPGSPGPDEILLGVRATAVNRADLLQRRGLYPPPPGASPILGLEAAGEVLEAGEGVTRFRPGDRVMALLAGGGYAERVLVPEGQVLPVPPGWSMEEAAAFPEVFATAWLNLFVLGEAAAGDVVLVHAGAGGVGTAAIQLCARAGVRCVVTVGSPEKARRCLELGAARAVVRGEEEFEVAVRDASGGRGADVVLDPVGGPWLDRNLRVLAPGGRLVVIGLLGGRTGTLDVGRLLVKRLRVIGSTLRSLPEHEKSDVLDGLWRRFGEDAKARRIGPVIHRFLPLADVDHAHGILERNENVGKVVLRVG